MCVTAELVTCGDCIHRVKTICTKTGDYVDPYEPACWRFELFHEPAVTSGSEEGATA